MWTHFASSESDPGFTAEQADGLASVVASAEARGMVPEMLHAANTAAALGAPGTRLDMVRVGIGLYGLAPRPDLGAGLGLRPAMRVVSHVAFLQRLPAGARPSYGRTRALPAAATVATVPIGYADGIPRRLAAAGGKVLIGGRRYPFAGAVTMDQVLIDVGDDPVAVGDEVVLLGAQGEEQITAEEWSRRLGTINYEIVCGFGPRMPRRYRG
jgi:alanine racemase